MRLLLDTCAFLWLAGDDDALPARVRSLCADRGNKVYLSAASVWEIVIKFSRTTGKLELPAPPQLFIPQQVAELALTPLPLSVREGYTQARLPWHHRDPYDRMLVCQAMNHDLILLTPDAEIRKYEVSTVWNDA